MKTISIMQPESTISVCVAMIAYNQAQFIEDAINGVLMQEADFAIQLVIGEDFSTDNTRQICERYARQYPVKIRLLESTKNLGIQMNFFRTIEACLDAPYVAFCEGDDVWLDKNKLQHQVAMLGKNKRALAHAHNVVRRNLITMEDSDFGAREDKELATNDLFMGWPFHDVSLIVRSDLLRSIPVNRLPQFISCDRFINMWIGCHGTMIYEGTKFMAMYRRHQFGASENANMVHVRQEDLAALSFFLTYLSDKKLYRELRLDAIKSLFSTSAALNSPITLPKWPLLLEFMQLASFWKITNVYHLFLIIFGHPYYRLYEALKKKLASRFQGARIAFRPGADDVRASGMADCLIAQEGTAQLQCTETPLLRKPRNTMDTNSESYYDSVAPNYVEMSSARSGYLHGIDQFVIQRLSTIHPGNLLDIGAGDGRRSKYLAETLGVKQVTVIESSLKMADEARKQIGEKNVLVGDATTIELPEEYFDAVISLWNVFGHISNDKDRRCGA